MNPTIKLVVSKEQNKILDSECDTNCKAWFSLTTQARKRGRKRSLFRSRSNQTAQD